MIRVGIDACNISAGGGVTHLHEILSALDLAKAGIKNIEVWSNRNTLSKISPKEGLTLCSHPKLEGGLLKRLYWQQKTLTKISRNRYDILYVLGGSYLGSYRPFVTMNRNLQPFDMETRKRYGPSQQKLRIALLEKVQAHTYRQAEGVIFLSEEAKRLTFKKIGDSLNQVTTVPHGIAKKFFKEPKKQHSLDTYSLENPFRILYASRINVYKHQWNVIEAVYSLKKEGYPVVLELVGNIENNQSRKLFREALNKYDSKNDFVHYHGRTTQDKLLDFYHSADLFVFASSCETFGQILLESMASALPIACSKRSAMPEVLKENGVYFNPEKPVTIANAIRKLLNSKELRQRLAEAAFAEAQKYSWDQCAKDTFNFIKKVHQDQQQKFMKLQ